MKKYKVERDKEEDFSKYKDFGKVVHQYERVTKRPKRPLYKDPKMFLALLLIILIAYLASVEKEEQEQGEPAPVEQIST